MLDQPLVIRVAFRVAVFVAMIAVVSIVADAETNDAIRPWLFVAQIAVFAHGGVRAAKGAPSAPITHGAAAAAGGLAIVIVVTAAARLVRGDGISAIGIVFFLLLAATVGALAAFISASRTARGDA